MIGLMGAPFLWTFGRPYNTPDLEPHGVMRSSIVSSKWRVFRGISMRFVETFPSRLSDRLEAF